MIKSRQYIKIQFQKNLKSLRDFCHSQEEYENLLLK